MGNAQQFREDQIICTLKSWIPSYNADTRNGNTIILRKKRHTFSSVTWFIYLYVFLPRNYIPTLEEFFEDAIEQADPEAMVEDEYKWVSLSFTCVFNIDKAFGKTCTWAYSWCGSVFWSFLFWLYFRLINDKNFAWKSLRLLAKRSPYFFAQQPSGNQGAPKTISKYLDGMIGKLAKDMPVRSSDSVSMLSWSLIFWLYSIVRHCHPNYTLHDTVC